MQKIQKDLAKSMNKSSKEIEKDLEIEFAMKITKMLPLDPHIDRDNLLSYSAYINFENSINNGDEKISEQGTSTTTASLINVDGKILFVYSYGGKDDLEWTRQASQKWVEKIISLNNPPPDETLKPNNDNFYKKYGIFIKIGFFMILSSIIGYFHRRGKPNKSISKEQNKELSDK